MNFHKTIGFLATLLLTLGLGVPDSFAQTVSSVALTLSPNGVVDTDDETTVLATVNVTLSGPATENMPVTVTLTDETSNSTDSEAAESGDYSLANLKSAVVIFADGETSKQKTVTFTIDPSEDTDSDNEVVQIQAAVGTGANAPTDMANLTITEFVSDVTLSLSSNSLVDTDATTTVSADITVNVSSAPSVATTVSVSLTDESSDQSGYSVIGLKAAITEVIIPANETSGTGMGTFTITPKPDADGDNEVVRIQAELQTQGHTDTANLTITEFVSSVALTLSPDSFEEGTTTAVLADVTVNVSSAPSEATALTVTLSDETRNSTDSEAAESGDYSLANLKSAVVTISPGETSGTGRALFDFTTTEDADADSENVYIQAAVSGHMGEDVLRISEGEVQTIGLTLAPSSVKETDGETTVTATVTVTLNSNLSDPDTLTVTLSDVTGAEGTDYTLGNLPSIEVPIAAASDMGSGTGTFTITPIKDSDREDEQLQIRAAVGGMVATSEITIEDDGVSAGDIEISVNPTEIREDVRARDVTVTATLKPTSTEAVTVNISTMVVGSEDMPTATPSGTIVIDAGMSSGSIVLSINPTDDDVRTTRTIQVTGSAPASGYTSGSADITVLDDDASIGTISVSADPPSLTKGSGAQTVKLTVHVVGQVDTPEGTEVVVDLAAMAVDPVTGVNVNKGTLSANSVTVTLGKHPDQDPETYPTQSNDSHGPGLAGTANLTLTAAEVAAGGTINVTASAEMYDSGMDAIPIRVRDGADVQGYRLVLVKPAAGGWANDNNDQVMVDVMRVGNVAYPWTDFQSIRVSVRDTAHDNSDSPHEIDWVMASNFNMEDDGSITFDDAHTGNSIGDVIWRGNDTIRFEIQIHHCRDDNNNEAGARNAGRCGSAEPSSNGQYLGAYVTAEFSVGGSTSTLSNRDSDTPVYPSNPTLVDEANRYVGDGKMFMVDNLDPSNAVVAFVNVTNADGEVLTPNSAVKVGDDIRVAIAVDGDVLFRESGMRVQIQPQDAKGEYNGVSIPSLTPPVGRKVTDLTAPVTRTTNFSASQVISASNDSLRASWKITEGFFTYKTDDFVDIIGPKGTVFEADNTIGRVLVAVKDQANNWSNAVVKTFKADSRSPSVTIRYPSADPDSLYDHTHPLRFSGHVSDDVYGYSEFLNPLILEVDEDIQSLKVFAVGADTLDISDQFSSNSVGDSTVAYETFDLNSPAKDDDGNWIPSSDNVGGTEIELAVLATDVLGNTTKTTIANVTHDAARPVITDWFPTNSLVPDGQINDATPPIFTLPEDVDSIAVTFAGSSGPDVTKGRGGVTTKGEDSIDFSGALTQDVSYDMTIFARDLAGNVFITPADSSSNMKFNAQFDNPTANRFSISTETDSVIAGQANILTIQAVDHDAASDTNRPALTYKNAVRISAWYNGGIDESVWFEGTGVDDDADNPDGMAMLSAADWRIGKRTVTVKSNKATGLFNVLLQHLDSGMGDTAVVGFDSAIDSLYVGAADFNRFEITAWEDGADGPVDDIWGDYTLRVVPVDRYGNPSVRAFKADFDSLDVLDTRVGDNAFEYKNGIDVEIVGVPTIEDFALLILPIEKEGASYDLVAPDDRRTQTVQVRVVNTSLMEGDSRSQNIRSSTKFDIAAPLTPMLTLWVPGSDEDETGNDVSIPADPGNVMVTVAAEGYNAGDMVTFTQDGMAMDPVTADDDGVARLMITASEVGTVTVSASDGRYSTDELTITFVDTPPAKPMRKKYVDVKGAPVYLIYSGDAPPDMMVDVADFLVLVSTFGSSDGDDHYNVQADVDDDGDVDVSDFLEFITSWGKTAVGPATKPLVLLPGINENAEFSLSLGSERVVAGELVAVDVSLANVQALVGYGFALNYETDKFEFISVAPADEDLLKSTGGETLFHHVVADGQVTVANGLYNGTAVSGGGDAVRFVFRVLREFEDNARFEIADGLVFDPGQLRNSAVVAGVLELQSTPSEFALHQNFPNPFNPDTTIKYDLAESADVTLQIYNVLGQVIRTLVASEVQNAGRYQIRWNGMDDRGVPVSSGIYFYQISADGKFSDVRKLMLLK